MTDRTCLNCGTALTGKYCVNCGQRATTRRFSLQTLRDEDFWEQNFSFTRGLPRTLLHLLYRPGYLAVEYLAGKRRQYFPFIGLLLLLIAADVVLRGYLDMSPEQMMEARYGIGLGGLDSDFMGKVLLGYFRLVQLFIIPVIAWWLYLLFRKSDYNYWEWLVATTLLISARLWIATPPVMLANLFSETATQLLFLKVSKFLVYGITFLFFYQLATRHFPRYWARAWRILLAVLTVYLVTKIALVGGIFVIHFLETGNWDVMDGGYFMINM